MRYQKIQVKIWDDERFVKLSEKARYLFLYLLTCPHSNAIGAYVIKIGYIAEDLSWTSQKGLETLSELLKIGLIKYDKSVSLIYIPNYLRYNPIENPNQFVCACKLIKNLPKSSILLELINTLETLSIRFNKPFQNTLETLSKPETETETETETEIKDLSPEPPQNGFDIKSLAALWNDFKPLELSKVNIPLTRKPKDIQKIKDQLKRNPDKSFWQQTILSIHNSKFLLGKNDRQWKATFDFVVDHANEIADGKYIDTPISTGNSKQINCLNHPERKAVYLNYFGQNLCQECKEFSEKLRNKNKSQELRV